MTLVPVEAVKSIKNAAAKSRCGPDSEGRPLPLEFARALSTRAKFLWLLMDRAFMHEAGSRQKITACGESRGNKRQRVCADIREGDK